MAASTRVFFNLLKKEARGKIPDFLQKGAEIILQSRKQERLAKDLSKLGARVPVRPKLRLDYVKFARTGQKVYLPPEVQTDIFLVDVPKSKSGSKSKSKSGSKSKSKKSGSKSKKSDSKSKSEKGQMSPREFYAHMAQPAQRSPRTRAEKKRAAQSQVMLFGRRRAH